MLVRQPARRLAPSAAEQRVAALLRALQERVVAAVWNAEPAELLAVQRDIVTGAERVCALARAEAPAMLPQAEEYRNAAQQALARLLAQQPPAQSLRGRRRAIGAPSNE